MKFEVSTIPNFDRQFKKLAKKFPSLKVDIYNLAISLSQNPEQGNALGNDCYEVRMAIQSKGKGKSGGARVITCLQVIATKVYLLSIYDKSEKESISDKDLSELLEQIPNEDA